MKFTAEKTEAKFLCACKDTEKAPFCDGSHSR
jgi:CDGSH-type Zn-finger protein